jgi:hypothetical protein
MKVPRAPNAGSQNEGNPGFGTHGAHAMGSNRKRPLEAGFDECDNNAVETQRLLKKMETLLQIEAIS